MKLARALLQGSSPPAIWVQALWLTPPSAWAGVLLSGCLVGSDTSTDRWLHQATERHGDDGLRA